MMEYIQADIWVRTQRMLGNEVNFVCADDTHGAPSIAAEKAGLTSLQFVAGHRRRAQAVPTVSTSVSTTGTAPTRPKPPAAPGQDLPARPTA